MCRFRKLLAALMLLSVSCVPRPYSKDTSRPAIWAEPHLRRVLAYSVDMFPPNCWSEAQSPRTADVIIKVGPVRPQAAGMAFKRTGSSKWVIHLSERNWHSYNTVKQYLVLAHELGHTQGLDHSARVRPATRVVTHNPMVPEWVFPSRPVDIMAPNVIDHWERADMGLPLPRLTKEQYRKVCR